MTEVVNPPVDYTGGLAPVPLISEELIEAEVAEANSYLSEIARSEKLAEIPVEANVQFGLPVQQILGAVDSHAADLVVLCSHGRTGVTRWVLGSAARGVIHQSSVPVLVLRERGTALSESRADAAQPFCAVVTLDGSPLAEAALVPAANLVAALAGPSQGELNLLLVIKPLTSATDEGKPPEHVAGTVVQAQAYLANLRERLLEQLRGSNLSISWSVTQAADVAGAIIAAAEQGTSMPGKRGCDALIMATHGRSGIGRWVIGSVTERVLEATKLPMLVVRPPQTNAQLEKKI